MRPTAIARLLIAVAALAVAGSLLALERDHNRCSDATRATFLAGYGSQSELRRYSAGLERDCRGSEPLSRIAAGLRERRPAAAARLARTAARREPENYVAWGVLALTAPPATAAAATRRARALNPLSALEARP